MPHTHEHKPIPNLTPTQIRAVMLTVNQQLADGEIDEPTAEGIRMALLDNGLPPEKGKVTQTRIDQFEKERKKRVQKHTKRLQKFQRDFMRRKREKLLALSDDEWNDLVSEGLEDE